MRCTKVLIAFAFVAIAVNVAHGAPIDMPLQNVQDLIPSLTNLNSLQGLSPQTLSSLSSDGKSSPLKMGDLNSKLSSSTQSLPLQSLPVGGSSGDKTSGLNVNKINQLLSSGAVSGTQSSTNNNVQRRDDTTDQSGLTSNTDSLTDSITKILSSVNPANLGGQSEKLTETNMRQSRSLLARSEPKIGGDEPDLGKKPKSVLPRDETNSPLTSSPMNGLSQMQIQQITSQIMDSITKSMPMGNMGGMNSPTSTPSTTSTTNNLLPNMRRDDTTDQSSLMPNTDSLKDSITKILSSMNLSNVGNKSGESSSMPSQNNVSPQKRSMDSEEDLYKRLSMDWFSTKPEKATVKKDRRDETMPNGLTNLQNEQITNQIMNQIKQVMGGMNMQNTNQDSSSTGSSTESSNNILPNRRATDETNLPSDQLQKTVLNIVSAVNLAQKSKQTTTQKRDGQTGSITNFNGLITRVTDVKSLPDNRLLIFGLLNGQNDAPSPVSTTSDADKPSKRGHPSPAGSVGGFPQIIDIKMVSNNVVAILAKTQSSS